MQGYDEVFDTITTIAPQHTNNANECLVDDLNVNGTNSFGKSVYLKDGPNPGSPLFSLGRRVGCPSLSREESSSSFSAIHRALLMTGGDSPLMPLAAPNAPNAMPEGAESAPN